MTTIAYRNGIMAADSQESDEEYLLKTQCQKLWVRNKCLIGIAKDSYAGLMFIEWITGTLTTDAFENRILATDDDFEALIVNSTGEIYTYNRYLVACFHDKPEFFAIGSGSKCALIAMEAGMSAEEAVKIACKYDLYSGGDIKTIRLDEI